MRRMHVFSKNIMLTLPKHISLKLVFRALMLARCEWHDNPDPISTERDECGKTRQQK